MPKQEWHQGPGGKAVAAIASKSAAGTKALSKVMSTQAKMKGIGVNSKLFGTKALGKNEGWLNKYGSWAKAGWSRHQGKTVFRYGVGKSSYYNVKRGKNIIVSKYHIYMGGF